MPEKPEVVTVAKTLKRQVLGKKITDVAVFWDNIIASPSVDEFLEKIVGEEILDITTRGKFLIFELNHYLLLIHLRMEGKFFFRHVDDPKGKHEHVFFTLDHDISFRFHDVRKFGKMYLLDKDRAYLEKPLCDLGLEYNDSSLDANYLYQKIHKKNLPIKTVLLDQSIITGIGNIYDDEVLFLSHISPIRKSSRITKKECEEIIINTKKVLDEAITMGGTTIKSFTSSEGVHGLFQNKLAIHGKKGNCPCCGEEIVKIKVGGRGTYYCPNCQK